jgi:hypothetical protein
VCLKTSAILGANSNIKFSRHVIRHGRLPYEFRNSAPPAPPITPLYACSLVVGEAFSVEAPTRAQLYPLLEADTLCRRRLRLPSASSTPLVAHVLDSHLSTCYDYLPLRRQ